MPERGRGGFACPRSSVASRRSGRAGGGPHGDAERLLPSGQRRERRVPAPDLPVGLERVVRELGEVHRGADGEVRERQRIARDECLARELPVQHLGGAVEFLGAFGDLGRVRLHDAEHARLDHVFIDEHRAGRIPVCEVPELPARDVEPLALIPREQGALRLLLREILLDRVRLPQHVIAVPQRRHAHVGIERGIFRRPVVALAEIDHAQRPVETEMIGHRHYLEGARARRKHEELDRHVLLLWR